MSVSDVYYTRATIPDIRGELDLRMLTAQIPAFVLELPIKTPDDYVMRREYSPTKGCDVFVIYHKAHHTVPQRLMISDDGEYYSAKENKYKPIPLGTDYRWLPMPLL